MGGKVPTKVGNGRGGARAGSGPKPKPIAKHRRNRVMLNFTDDERNALAKAAKGKPISAFAREIVIRYLARRK
jgi:hypothetical protein